MADEASRTWAGDMSAAYDECLVPGVFRPYAEDLVVRIAAGSPQRVLELAAGSGVVTALLSSALPAAAVTATDLNPAMVEVGAERAPLAIWQQADATTLPFDAASFDCVACQFGVMFFPDRRAAYSEVRRVLTDGGQFLFNVWGRLEDHDFQLVVDEAVAALFPDDPPHFLADVPHGYHDADQIAADLVAAGLQCESTDLVELMSTGASAAEIARGYCCGTPLRQQIEARGDLATVTAAAAKALEERFGSGPISGGMTALVVTAVAG